MTFSELLTERTRRLDTRLCLGLDPRLDRYRDVAHLRTHTLDVLEACAAFAACVKPQLAFYEALGLEGFKILEEVCGLARTLGLPVILDGKRGDIGSTARGYARAWLAGPHAGSALTVNPFLGFETLAPFVDVAREGGGAVFVLVKTSNPGSADLQARGVAEKVAREVARLGEPVGAVVGATHPGELAHWRTLMPASLWLLPGLGAQGARAADLAPAFLPGGVGAVVNASRGVQYARDLSVAASAEAARGFRDELNAVV